MMSSPVWTQIEASSKLWCDKVPEPIRFVTAAGLGNILFFHIDRAFYESIVVPFTKGTHQLFQKNKETISFFFSYLIQVGFQHFLNAVLVYGLDTISTLEKYVDTLILSYSSYSVSLIGSTLGNALLISRGVSKNVAFWSTIVTFGMVNFFLLRFLIGGFGSSCSGIRGDEEKEEDKKVERRKLDKMKGENVQRQWNSRLGGRRNNTKSLGMVGVRGGGGEEGACTLPRNVFVSTVRWINACRGDVDFMVNLVTDLGPRVSYNVRNE